MTQYCIDPTGTINHRDDRAAMLMFFLEHHGEVTLHPDQSIKVNLDPMPGLDAETVHRWAPVILNALPEIRAILLARGAAATTEKEQQP
jgi:hypothetical protein